jgi:hypothetical protein
MSEKEKDYTGIWMKIGCILSTLVILCIVFAIGLLVYNLLRGN